MFQILATLAAAATAAPQIVPYVHEEIAAEPYVHEEVAAEPYVHIEPEISQLALGIAAPRQLAAAPQFATPRFAAPVQPQQFAAPVQQQQFLPQQFVPTQAGFINGVWTGTCYNNLGAGVPCYRTQ